MEASDRYRAEVRELFLALRGGGLMLSPLDEDRVGSWEARGLPLPLALQALREAHAAWLGSGPGPRRRPFALRSAQPFVDGLLREASSRAGGLAAGSPGAQAAASNPAAEDRCAAVAASLRTRAASATGASRAAYLAAAEALAGTRAPLDPWEAVAEAQGLAYLKALPRIAQRSVVRGAVARAGRRGGVPPAIHRGTLRTWLCEAARSHGALIRPSELP